MNNLSDELKNSLKQIALNSSVPFCYHCYVEAPLGVCPQCHSDDLMLLIRGVGLDYGWHWVIEHLISENLTPVDTEETFEQSIRGCYDETVKIGWIEYDVVGAIKELDPISWEMALSEWIDEQASEGLLVSFDSGATHVWLHDLESFVESMLEKEAG